QLALSDVGDEAFDQALLVRLEQQVHYHVDGTAILAPQSCFVAEQPLPGTQHVANPVQGLLAADKQMVRQISQAPERLLGSAIAQPACQRRISSADAVLQAGLKDAVHCMFEKTFVAIALSFEFFEAAKQFGIMTFACRVRAQAKQAGQSIVLFRALRHRPLRHRAGWRNVGWSGCRDPAWHAWIGTGCQRYSPRAASGFHRNRWIA